MLFCDHSHRRWFAGRGRWWRERECDLGIPAIGTVLRRKFLVAFQIEVALEFADREDETELGSDADHLQACWLDDATKEREATKLLASFAEAS